MKRTPSSDKYTKEHFLTQCGGYEEFLQGGMGIRQRLALGYLSPKPNEAILDVGCGRGEIVKECHKLGVNIIGMDYSQAAMEISKELVDAGFLVRASATSLPFKDEVFDKVLLLDIVEHLDDADLVRCITETRRVLRKGGMVLVHTPNKWHKPLTLGGLLLDKIKHLDKRRLIKELKDIKSDVRQGYEHFEETHINVQNPIYWRRLFSQWGFKTKIWLDRPTRSERWKTIVHRLLFFTQDLWLKGIKSTGS